MADSQNTISQEIWKEIPGFPGYEVSNRGRVRSYWRRMWKDGFGSGSKTVLTNGPPMLLKRQISHDGYDQTGLRRDGKQHTLKVHRLLLLAFVGPCPPGMVCRHLDGIRTHCFIENLTWGTHSENEFDRIKHGNNPNYAGINNPQAKLTDKDVIKIRELAAQKTHFQTELGRMFNISQTTVWRIINHKNWTHLP